MQYTESVAQMTSESGDSEQAQKSKIAISVVVPVFNERESVQLLYDALTTELQKVAVPYEIVFVDDGSTDGSFAIISASGATSARPRPSSPVFSEQVAK
jgi:glycosyltransferase involved in cell wall biosynthesis